jgi:hypothetical protein
MIRIDVLAGGRKSGGFFNVKKPGTYYRKGGWDVRTLFVAMIMILSLIVMVQLSGCTSREEKVQRYEKLVEQKSRELQPVIEQKASEIKITPGMSQGEYNRQVDQKAKELEPYYEQKAKEIQKEM